MPPLEKMISMVREYGEGRPNWRGLNEITDEELGSLVDGCATVEDAVFKTAQRIMVLQLRQALAFRRDLKLS